MRQFRDSQLPLSRQPSGHQHSQELAMISRILDENPEMLAPVHRDLVGAADESVGRDGLSAEQVLRIALLKQIHRLSYRELEFHLGDSAAFHQFARLKLGPVPCFGTLQANIKRIRAQTWESIHGVLMGHAVRLGVEDGQKIRADCTSVEAPIHEPSDSSLLYDCVRVLTRTMQRIRERVPSLRSGLCDHTRRAKRRAQAICYARRKHDLRELYRDLLRVTDWTRGYASEMLAELLSPSAPEVEGLAYQLQHDLALTERVIDQTQRRVLGGETVPAHEKVVSIFEPHTDILVKGRRDVLYGHKVCLTGGASSLIVDCVIEEGNPADATLVDRTLERQIELFGRAPRQACFDGGFASKANIATAKALGVEDIAFHKKRGIAISEMVRSAWVFRSLKNFRAGIEGCISTLKRVFGLDRCTWRGKGSFHSYVWASVTSFNLVVLARHCLAREHG